MTLVWCVYLEGVTRGTTIDVETIECEHQGGGRRHSHNNKAGATGSAHKWQNICSGERWKEEGCDG